MDFKKLDLQKIDTYFAQIDEGLDGVAICCRECGQNKSLDEILHNDCVYSNYDECYYGLCYDCIDNYFNIETGLRYLAANNLEHDYFVNCYMQLSCDESADNRIVDMCKAEWQRNHDHVQFCNANQLPLPFNYELESLRDYVLASDGWAEWVAAEMQI